MAENKTKPTAISVDTFLDAIEPSERRAEGKAVCALFAEVTGESPAMWGPSIIGFGRYRYALANGKTAEMCRAGFSPRKTELVFYCSAGAPERPAPARAARQAPDGQGMPLCEAAGRRGPGSAGEYYRCRMVAYERDPSAGLTRRRHDRPCSFKLGTAARCHARGNTR